MRPVVHRRCIRERRYTQLTTVFDRWDNTLEGDGIIEHEELARVLQRFFQWSGEETEWRLKAFLAENPLGMPCGACAPPPNSCLPCDPPPPCVTFRRVVVSLRGPGQSPVRPFACCVGSLLSVGCCGRCSCWCRFRVRGAQWLVWGKRTGHGGKGRTRGDNRTGQTALAENGAERRRRRRKGQKGNNRCGC